MISTGIFTGYYPFDIDETIRRIKKDGFSCVQLDAVSYTHLDVYKRQTLSGGEALLQAEAIVPLVELCETEKIPVAIETCGYVSLNYLKKIIPKTELFLFDIKTLDSVKFKKYTGGNLKIVLDNFLYLIKVSREKVVIRIPVIPGFNSVSYTHLSVESI